MSVYSQYDYLVRLIGHIKNVVLSTYTEMVLQGALPLRGSQCHSFCEKWYFTHFVLSVYPK